MNEFDNTKTPQSGAPEDEAAIWGERLIAKHVELHDESSRLLLAASFGSLFFLTQFQPLFPAETRVLGCLLDYSWLFSGVSAFCGSVHFGLLVLRPAFAERLRRRMLGDLRRTLVALTEEEMQTQIDGFLNKCVAWYVFYWLHLGSFIVLIGLLTVFKIYNRG